LIPEPFFGDRLATRGMPQHQGEVDHQGSENLPSRKAGSVSNYNQFHLFTAPENVLTITADISNILMDFLTIF